MMVLQLLFFLSLLGIVHSYLIYPFIMLRLGTRKKALVDPESTLPQNTKIEILFAAYNEESVIEEKIRSSLSPSIRAENLSLRIGTDNCSDQTDSIIRSLQKEYPNLRHKVFTQRTGKSGIINHLVEESDADYLILTDANIIFNEQTIEQLIGPLLSKDVGIVGGNIIYQTFEDKGISKQENIYLQLENRIKLAESQLFGATMGVEGGCYAIKRNLFPQIPPLFFMEDFYVSLYLIEKGYKVLFNPDAQCFEDISVNPDEEFKRKVRISIGNFQNLNRFKSLIFKKFNPIGFAFSSHKVLRWLTPFLLIFLFVSSLSLSYSMPVYGWFSALYFLILSLGLLGILFSHYQSVKWLKYPGHFLYMNLALLKGFFVYLKGVKSNVWQPTSRNQK
jgi:cellulose synthase/poly-beta-1,6-N-acetylglucosamine synthase-like glycosyltransferase